MTALSEENIEWSVEKFTLTTFRERKIPLPAIILVTGGHYGRDDTETFSSDDILVLHEWRTQERVLARKQKISISIPLEFEHRIQLVAEPSRPEYFMSEIIRHFKPPLKARFKGGANVNFNIKNVPVNTDNFGSFILISSHLVDYVTVSAVLKGKINQEELFHLPLHRQVRFKVAQTTLGIPIEQHGGLLNLPHHMVMEHMLGILDYTELLDTMDEYDYIQEIPKGGWNRSENYRQPPPPTAITRVNPGSTTRKKTGQENNGKMSTTSGFTKLGEVPEDITGLTINQVCFCLKLFNLEEFTDKFRKDMMDGKLLKTCTVDDLKEQYDMSHLSARKLCMFANEGWRPKD